MGTGTPDRYPKALDSNSRVEENGRTRESEASDGEEGRATVRGVARTSGEEIQTKSGDCARKCAGQYSGNDAGGSEVLSIHHTDKVIHGTRITRLGRNVPVGR
jgi:hypothetical protein